MYILILMSNNLVNQSTKAISTNELRWIGPVLAVVSSGPMDLFLLLTRYNVICLIGNNRHGILDCLFIVYDTDYVHSMHSTNKYTIELLYCCLTRVWYSSFTYIAINYHGLTVVGLSYNMVLIVTHKMLIMCYRTVFSSFKCKVK